jgi:peptidyl-prolyl cis-trans isomerase A (cyclophilin A)
VRREALATLAGVVALGAAGCGGSSHPGAPTALLRPAQLKAKAPQLYTVEFVTTKGTFTIGVHRTWAPRAADRFYNLVRNHFYDGDVFFRVVPGFVVQFGISPYPAVSKAWQNARIPDDPPVGVPNDVTAVSFASAGPNTRTTQVFIDLADNRRLDQLFVPFGTVDSGFDVVRKLYGGYGDAPTNGQPEMMAQGNAWLGRHYPRLDRIETAKVTKASSPALP